MVWPSEDFGKIEMALDVKKVPHPCSRRSSGIELATFRLPGNPLYLQNHMPPLHTYTQTTMYLFMPA